MGGSDLRTNPDAMPGAPSPSIGRYSVGGTTLYGEVRGSGPPILLVPGGAEDAEGWRPVAERLSGHTVVTYDRRGTLRSGRDDWPGGGSAQHADDAATLLRILGLDKVTVFGGSSAGIIAVQLALRHPGLVRRALVYEPGYFLAVPGGDEVHARASAAIEAHLEAHASDWAGAYAAFARAAFPSPHPEGRGFLAPPPGRDWYAAREDLNAEALLRDDIPLLTTEQPDDAAIAALGVDVRFSYGTASPPIFQEIAEDLAAVRGEVPDVLEGVGHSLYHYPDEAAEYIASR